MDKNFPYLQSPIQNLSLSSCPLSVLLSVYVSSSFSLFWLSLLNPVRLSFSYSFFLFSLSLSFYLFSLPFYLTIFLSFSLLTSCFSFYTCLIFLFYSCHVCSIFSLISQNNIWCSQNGLIYFLFETYWLTPMNIDSIF